MKEHNACVELERQVRRALGSCGRFSLGGVADADFIEDGGAYTAIVASLAPYYVGAELDTQKQISQFIKGCGHLQRKITDETAEDVRKITKKLKSFLDDLGVRAVE